MSRAINLDVPVADVTRHCERAGLVMSTIEPLHSGGTRVVLLNAHDAALVRRSFAAKLIEGTVTRVPLKTR